MMKAMEENRATAIVIFVMVAFNGLLLSVKRHLYARRSGGVV